MFSHGFGVKKDSRGMFTEIADNFTSYKPVMFDYNVINPKTNEVTVYSYSKQAKMLKRELDKIYQAEPDAVVTLICHSQGCVIPCLIYDLDVSKAILLAPPKILSSNMSQNKAVKRTEHGEFKIPRKDGTTTIVTKEFVEELDQTFPLDLYVQLSKNTGTYIIVANQDEILKDTDFSELSEQIKIYKISGNHNFTGQDRKGLIAAIATIL